MGLRLVSKAVRHRGAAGESVLACEGGQSVLLSGTWRGSQSTHSARQEHPSAVSGHTAGRSTLA